MSDETYTRQQSRRDKRDIFGALRALGNGDNGPAELLTRRTFLTGTAAAVMAPALSGLSTPALMCGTVTVETMGAVYAEGIPVLFAARGGRIVPLPGEETPENAAYIEAMNAALDRGDYFPNRAGHVAAMHRAQVRSGGASITAPAPAARHAFPPSKPSSVSQAGASSAFVPVGEELGDGGWLEGRAERIALMRARERKKGGN